MNCFNATDMPFRLISLRYFAVSSIKPNMLFKIFGENVAVDNGGNRRAIVVVIPRVIYQFKMLLSVLGVESRAGPYSESNAANVNNSKSALLPLRE